MGQHSGKLKLSRKDRAFYKNHLRFTKSEIDDWYNEFKKRARSEHGHDFLTEKDFIAVYSNVFYGDSSDYCRHIFRTFDKNGNGEVSFREFLTGLHESGSDDLDTNLKWAFEVYDVHKTGTISKLEMSEIVKSVYKMLDPDRVKIPPEYRTPDVVVETMFATMDTNHDDILTWEEFHAGVTTDSFLLNLLQCNPPM